LIEVVVAKKRREAVDIFSYELVGHDGRALPPFTAGAHIDVQLPGGLLRQYSLYNCPSEHERYLIAVLRAPQSRGGSVVMHDRLHEGSVLTISEPRNRFELVAGARRSILLAGGIGVTPLLSMAEKLSELQADFELHYCARSAERMAFRHRIHASAFTARTRFHLDDRDDAQRLDLNTTLSDSRADVHLYVCGPAGFMQHVIAGAKQRGWGEEQIHREYFSADVAVVGGDAFAVKIASTGQVLTVPEHKTVIEVLRDAGIRVEVSCEQGVCGTCVTPVLEGELDHRDLFLTEAERALGKIFTPCCSRGRGVVVLDL
jgi:vanillate O-demethylase ferredoxin subunit